MEVVVKETRGRKPKYDFSGMEIGEIRRYEALLTSTILICAKNWVKRKGFDWGFRCYRDGDKVAIVRVK
jgi:hypothetical protein